MGTRFRLFGLVSVCIFALALSAQAQFPAIVSPGAVDHLAEIEGRCPSFSWGETNGANHYEIEVYSIPPDVDPADSDLTSIERMFKKRVLHRRVSGGATSWTPNLEQCLTPGERYVWFVKSVMVQSTNSDEEDSSWSDGLFFSISMRPSSPEVTAALDVLRRYASVSNGAVVLSGSQVTTNTLSSSAMTSTASNPNTRSLMQSKLNDKPPLANSRVSSTKPGLQAPMSVTTAQSAIKGLVDDTTGEAYGVVGVSASPDGAGIAAVNTSGGADLVLDGSADSQTDTLLSQSGIDRPSVTPQTFNIQNSVGGGMSLQVEGFEVVTTVTDKDTLGDMSCTSGDMPRWDGFNWTCVQGSLITSVAGGSGLTGGGSAGAVTVNIGTGLVTSTHLGVDSVGASELIANTVTSADIANGTITYSDINTNSVQRRITGTCPAGNSIRAVASNGTVTCEADDHLKIAVGDYLIADIFNGGDTYDHWYYGVAGTHICYLSFVQLRDVDGSGEDAYCNIYPDDANNRWTLRAHSEPGDDSDAKCRARCYTFHY